MRLPFSTGALSRIVGLAGVALVAACAGEATSPTAMRPVEATNAALVGISDGTYEVSFNAREDQVIGSGGNRLVIPANSICDMQKSGYGPEYWDQPCTPQKGKVTLTIVVKNSQTAHPQMNFYPAMRFSPDKEVRLYLQAPQAVEQAAKEWWMFYCNDFGKCMDESLTDSSLQTYIDYTNSVIFRRIKHFSGYVVAERVEEAEALQ
jgi:hypothetical protein